MAEAQAVIARLAQQVAQLTVDKAVLEVELAETRERLTAAETTVECQDPHASAPAYVAQASAGPWDRYESGHEGPVAGGVRVTKDRRAAAISP